MLPPFILEQYLLEHEHQARLSLCASGLEPITVSELLSLADAETLALLHNTSLDYTHPLGSRILREAIAQQYESVTTSQISVFAGAAEGILCTLQGLLTPQDHAVVITPCYQSLLSIPASLCPVTAVRLEDTNGWQLDLDRVQSALMPNTKIIVINFPNNPTGTLPSADVMGELIEMARKRGIYIFSDEVYRLMEVNPADRLPPMASWYERGISVSSVSKAYGLPGLRIGWVASQASEVLSAAIDIKHYTSICVNSASETLAVIALRSGSQILERNLQVMRSNLPMLDQFFERMQEYCRWVRPKGGCLGFPRYLLSDSSSELCRGVLEESGVQILPGSLYGSYDSHFRIGFGRRNCGEGLGQLESLLKQYSPGV